MPVNVAAAPSGLDSRPVNTTCLAFDRPSADASVNLQRVFPSLPISDVVVLAQPPGDSSYWYFTTREGIIGRFANTPGVSSWETVIDLRGGSGGVIPQDAWSLLYVDSQELAREDGAATNAFDGNPLTMWHTEWSVSEPVHPHEIQVDLGAVYDGMVFVICRDKQAWLRMAGLRAMNSMSAWTV